jgi:hypothetical protein
MKLNAQQRFVAFALNLRQGGLKAVYLSRSGVVVRHPGEKTLSFRQRQVPTQEVCGSIEALLPKEITMFQLRGDPQEARSEQSFEFIPFLLGRASKNNGSNLTDK